MSITIINNNEDYQDTLNIVQQDILNIVQYNGYSLHFASEEQRNNPEIVLDAVKQDGYELQFASDNLKNNP